MGAFFIGQVIGILVISRVLSLIFEFTLIKLLKVNKYLGVILAMVITFLLYQLPALLLGNVSDIPGTSQAMARREADVDATNNILMGVCLAIWMVVDFVVVTFLMKKKE